MNIWLIILGVMLLLISLHFIWLGIMVIRAMRAAKRAKLMERALRDADNELILRLVKRFSERIAFFRQVEEIDLQIDLHELTVGTIMQWLKNEEMNDAQFMWC